MMPTTRKPSPATLAARVLGSRGGSARTEAQTAARRANGAKGGRPVAVSAEVRYLCAAGRVHLVQCDGCVLVYDDVAGLYSASLGRTLSAAQAAYVRARARSDRGTATDPVRWPRLR